MDSLKQLFEGLMLPLALGIFGGMARLCRIGCKSWRQFAGGLTVSAFTGVVTHLALQDTGLSASTQAAITAVSGYSGGAVIDGFLAQLLSRARGIPNGQKPVE